MKVLLHAAADTGLPVHIKKGQFCSAEALLQSAAKVFDRGNPAVVLCERGSDNSRLGNTSFLLGK